MSQTDSTLPLIIPYDGPGDFSDEEIIGPIQLSDPLLQPVSWEELKTLNGRSTVLGSPWGQYYKLEYDTDSTWEKGYRISQAVKCLEDAAEKVREARNVSSPFRLGGVSGGDVVQSGLFGAAGQFGASGGLSRASLFGAPNQGPQPLPSQPAFGTPDLGGFGGVGSTGRSVFSLSKPIPRALWGTPGGAATGAFGRVPGGRSTSPLHGSGVASIENYALMEVPSYPPTDIPEVSLQDWFVGGSDKLDNAIITTTDNTEALRRLLLAISKPGFEAMLAVKVSGQKPDVLRVSCACAYAIKILHRQGREAFNFVLLHAPPSVLLDTSLFARSALIDASMEHKILQAAAVALTTPEPKDAKEVTYARAVGVMVAKIISRSYSEGIFKDEGERAGTLERNMATLIKNVLETPTTSPAPSPRAAITAAAALCALILAGALTFADELQQRREKNRQRAELAVSAVLSCIGFAVPVPYLAAASGLATILGTLIVRHIWKPRDPGLKSTLVIQTLQTVLWPLVRRREVVPVGLAGLSFEEASEFKMFFELTLQSAWMGYWQQT
ncbi:MAG: hypothetical protein M1839_002198 [Geoglossum umbratile]|nr:MAG: hypothetical protein M1839_002198 [Geoglossum umbratile]